MGRRRGRPSASAPVCRPQGRGRRTAPRQWTSDGERTLEFGFDEAAQVLDPAGCQIAPREFPAMVAAEADGARVRLTQGTGLTPDVRRLRGRGRGRRRPLRQPILAPFDRETVHGFRPACPEARRFDLRGMNCPSTIAARTGPATFIACLAGGHRPAAHRDRFPRCSTSSRRWRASSTSSSPTSANPFPFDFDEFGKRRVASVLVECTADGDRARHHQRGPLFPRRRDRGRHRLRRRGPRARRGRSSASTGARPSSRFACCPFDVLIGGPFTDARSKQLRANVEYLKPAHIHFVTLVEPSPPAFVDHWELGVTEVGVTTDLH